MNSKNPYQCGFESNWRVVLVRHYFLAKEFCCWCAGHGWTSVVGWNRSSSRSSHFTLSRRSQGPRVGMGFRKPSSMKEKTLIRTILFHKNIQQLPQQFIRIFSGPEGGGCHNPGPSPQLSCCLQRLLLGSHRSLEAVGPFRNGRNDMEAVGLFFRVNWADLLGDDQEFRSGCWAHSKMQPSQVGWKCKRWT